MPRAWRAGPGLALLGALCRGAHAQGTGLPAFSLFSCVGLCLSHSAWTFGVILNAWPVGGRWPLIVWFSESLGKSDRSGIYPYHFLLTPSLGQKGAVGNE